jgi:sucrose-6-phosphate hydrolase SacC (GH32 family)
LFELAVDGDQGKKKWVLFGGDGQYVVGQFDGTKFVKEAGKFRSDWGRNFYAAQTYSDVPDGRRILIGWMREGKYPRMPFNQQMGFPVELTLRTTAEGIRLCKWPVKEIETLYAGERTVTAAHFVPRVLPGETFDLEAEIDFTGVSSAGVDVQGNKVIWAREGKLSVMGTVVDVAPPEREKARLRLLIDRTSVEVFANGGQVTVSQCFLPDRDPRQIVLFTRGEDGKSAVTWKVREIKSAWKRD